MSYISTVNSKVVSVGQTCSGRVHWLPKLNLTTGGIIFHMRTLNVLKFSVIILAYRKVPKPQNYVSSFHFCENL